MTWQPGPGTCVQDDWVSVLSAKGKGLRFGVLVSLSGCLVHLYEHLSRAQREAWSGPLTVCL